MSVFCDYFSMVVISGDLLMICHGGDYHVVTEQLFYGTGGATYYGIGIGNTAWEIIFEIFFVNEFSLDFSLFKTVLSVDLKLLLLGNVKIFFYVRQ